jgi:Zn-dependent peptidase ImmA (M78 family)
MMQDTDCYKYVDFRMQQANFTASSEQIFANYFGESLLMPESEVRLMAEEGISLDSMAAHFGVTEEAMEYRMKQLGIVADALLAV